MGNKPGDDAQGKKPYEKPVLRQVGLRPEEAVLGGCKNSASGGPLQALCDSAGPCTTLTVS